VADGWILYDDGFDFNHPLLWFTFLVYWIVQARGVKPAAEKQSRTASFAYRLPLVFCGILHHLKFRIASPSAFVSLRL
jgi:hypothetical protein